MSKFDSQVMNVFLLLSGIAAIFLAGNWALRHREHHVAKMRTGQGFDEFVGYFSGAGIPRDRLREVYEYFQSLQSVKNFPVQADDDLYKVFGICNEDVDDAVLELAKRWHRKLPASSDLPVEPPVRTVADMVRLLHRFPQEQ